MTIYNPFSRLMHIFHKFVPYNYGIMREYIFSLLVGLLVFFTPIQGLIISVGIVIIFDTVTGIYRSVKKRGWKSISSHKLSNIINKMLLYELSLIFLYPIDKFVLNDLLLNLVSVEFFATKLACVLLILVEITSIKENIEQALEINIWQNLKAFLKRIKEVSKDIDEIQQ